MKAIYPSLDSLVINWHPSKIEPLKGIVSISITTQPEMKWPFLVTRTLDNAEPASVEEIHRMIRDGLLNSPIHHKLTVIQDMIEGIKSVKSEVATSDTKTEERIDIVLSELEFVGIFHPVYILASAPKQQIEIQDIFSRDSEAARLIENPPGPRPRGFDLSTGQPTRIVAGERLRSIVKGELSLNLWRDGALVFAADARDFLCWSKKSSASTSPLRINPLALVESLYTFSALTAGVYERSSARPDAVDFTLEIRHMTVNNVPASITPGGLDSPEWKFDRNVRSAPHDTKAFKIIWNDSELRPGEISFKLARELYVWFGLHDNEVPYSEGAGSGRVISPEEIRRHHP
jgi:hypothetical protein